MSAEWTGFAMVTALRDAIAARTGITSLTPEVRVVSYLPSKEEQFPDAVIIGYRMVDADEMQRIALGANRYDEVVDLISRVQATRPGAGQEVADEVRTRVKVLLAEVETEVRSNLPDVGDQSWAGKADGRDVVVQATNREGVAALVASVDFSIVYKARTS